MKRLLIDVSSVLWMSLLAGKDQEFGKMVEHEGKMVHVNGWQFGLECATSHITTVLRELDMVPSQCIFVVEGKMSKARRKSLYTEYKESRSTRPPESYEAFNKCREELVTMFRNVGAQAVVNDGCESDDVIAFLAQNLDGEKIILSQDGDLAALINPQVSMWRKGALLTDNPYGPFPNKFITVYKALVGDSSDNYPGAKGFGEKAFLDLLVWAGDAGLAALEGMINRRTLHELEEDVAEFRPLRKVIDNAEMVYTSYAVAKLYPEWVDHPRQPLQFSPGMICSRENVGDQRLARWATGNGEVQHCDWWTKLHPPKVNVEKNHAVFDCELIGKENPVFLVCFKVVETGERASFWWHRDGDMVKLNAALQREDIRWVSFNGIHFDAPLMSAAIGGHDPKVLKDMANAIIIEGEKSWSMPSRFGYDQIEFDHIDLIEVSPGVRVSLKTFAGRMGYLTMVDLPFHHDQDLTAEQLVVLESYCRNDLGVTEALFQKLRAEINLRTEMSLEHDIDLRSKSDAQVAEAILKKVANIKGRSGSTPSFVMYQAPDFIETDSDVICDLLLRLQGTQFKINPANGQVVAPDYLDEPIDLCSGKYQVGVGGLHSQHDKKLHVVATDEMLISDFDVAGYYPKTMLIAGLTPRVEGGERFIAAYKDIYDRRIEAKRAGDKKVANALKISLNGTFGKLGSPYSAFYSPDLMLAVTLTGQLNLMCLIYDIEFHPSIKVLSANTDGIAVHYPARLRDRVLNVIRENAVRTGYEYEETRYAKIAMKDVNNYLAVTTDLPPVIITPDGEIVEGKGKIDVKRKGLYAATGLMKNPTMEVCSNMAIDYLKDGIYPSEAIKNYDDIRDFVAIRNVKGGGIQYDKFVEIDDWIPCEWKDDGQKIVSWFSKTTDKIVKRVSKPPPVQVGVGGEAFGRIARWYMQKDSVLPINYLGSGNRVPKTEGAKLCMTLPAELPDDLDLDWYVRETIDMLGDMGVEISDISTETI